MTQTLTVFRAYDRTVLAEVEKDDGASLEAKLSIAFDAYRNRKKWLEPYERIAILRKVATSLEGQLERFAGLIASEGGKPYADAMIEAVRAVDGIRNAADELRNFAGEEIPMGLTAASVGRFAFTTKEPIGVVAAISAFNHPLNLIVHQITPAIAVGSPVIIKPAATTPMCCRALVQLFWDAGLEEQWCQTLVTDDNVLAESLATDRRVAFLSFIGSAKVGWYLRSKLPPGTRYALEHGGAAPVIVDETANLSAVVGPIAKGSFYHAGQVCVSTQRVFVAKSAFSAFVDALSSRMETLTVGDPLAHDTEVGPLILPRETDRVEAWISEAVASGARQIGGGRISETTLRPSLLLRPDRGAKVSQLEIFGPVVCIYDFDTLDDAIAQANDIRWSFQASIFTNDIKSALLASRNLDASAVMVNDHTAFRTDWMPFAGRKESGYGVGGIPWTMRDMSHDKMIVLKT